MIIRIIYAVVLGLLIGILINDRRKTKCVISSVVSAWILILLICGWETAKESMLPVMVFIFLLAAGIYIRYCLK